MKPINQLAPSDLPVPPGSRDHLILLGLRFVQMQVDASNRLFREASERANRHRIEQAEADPQ